MNGMMQSAGWAMLGLVWAWLKDFMLSIGIPGLIVLATGTILLVTASVKSLKFMQTGKGMSLTAAVMFAALTWMWLMNQPAGAKTRPIAPASLMAKSETPSPILASKAAPIVAPVAKPPAELLATRSAPVAAQVPSGWWPSFPLVETVPTAIGFLSQLPAHLSPIHEAKPAHAPVHHSPAPVASRDVRTQHATAVVSPNNTPAASRRPGHASGGSSMANNRQGSGLAMSPARLAARQRNMEALNQMGFMMQRQMNQSMSGGSFHHGMPHQGSHH